MNIKLLPTSKVMVACGALLLSFASCASYAQLRDDGMLPGHSYTQYVQQPKPVDPEPTAVPTFSCPNGTRFIPPAACQPVPVPPPPYRPAIGKTCFGSPQSLAIGNHLPGNSDTSDSVIAGIDAWEGASGDIFGWTYTTDNGQSWFQRNAADTGAAAEAVIGLLKYIGGFGPLMVEATTIPYEMTNVQDGTVIYDLTESGYAERICGA